jgi:hypothetical protein
LRVNRRFGRTYRLLLQSRKMSWARNQRESRWQADCDCSDYLSTLKMEVIHVCSSKTSVDYQRTTRRYIPEDGTLWTKLVPLFNYAPRYEDLWRNGGVSPRILNLGTIWTWAVSLTPRQIHPRGKSTWYQLDMGLIVSGPQSRSWHCAEEKIARLSFVILRSIEGGGWGWFEGGRVPSRSGENHATTWVATVYKPFIYFC